MKIPLSILDLSIINMGESSGQALRNTVKLAQIADQLGYTRYWLGEHHNTKMMASSTPEVIISYIAQATERIRVGSGGVMLSNHSPLKVAETFRVLEAMHPGRIDLGIGRATGTDSSTAIALRSSRESLDTNGFFNQLMDLLAFSGRRGGFPEKHLFHSVEATPSDVALPPIWLLGSSDYSAYIAAELGVGFAFAQYINPGLAIKAIRMYRAQFKPSEWLQEPKVILTASVVCADTETQAEMLATSSGLAWVQLQDGQSGPLPSPEDAKAYSYTAAEQEIMRKYHSRQIVGSPPIVREKLIKLLEETDADELMIIVMIYGHENRARTYTLLAKLFEL